jgi:adenylylsulfate kinase
MSRPGWAVWFVGLPGSGKSSVAECVAQRLREQGWDVFLLQMDERRKAYFPEPQYTDEERARAYELFVDEAAQMVAEGRNVIMDGTAAKLLMRQRAREKIQKFAEVYIHCSLSTAMQRESERPQGKVMADLYAKALKRRETGRDFPGLGQVVGVDVQFEKNPAAELRVENDRDKSLQDSVDEVMRFLNKWLADV